jgi:hypothetical protein
MNWPRRHCQHRAVRPVQGQGYVSGPVTDTLRLRLAGQTQQGGDWQYNYTRNAKAGSANQSGGRFLAEWEPSDRLTMLLNVNGWYNKSDSQFPQTISFSPLVSANLASLPAATSAGLINQPLAPADNRAADWPTSFPLWLSPQRRFLSGLGPHRLQADRRHHADLVDGL